MTIGLSPFVAGIIVGALLMLAVVRFGMWLSDRNADRVVDRRAARIGLQREAEETTAQLFRRIVYHEAARDLVTAVASTTTTGPPAVLLDIALGQMNRGQP